MPLFEAIFGANPFATLAAGIFRVGARVFGGRSRDRPDPPKVGIFDAPLTPEVRGAILSAVPAVAAGQAAPAQTVPAGTGGNPFGIPGFGGEVAANDPIFREAILKRIGVRVLGPVGAVTIFTTERLIKELERRQVEQMDRDLREQDAEANEAASRAARERQLADLAKQARARSDRSPRPQPRRIPRPQPGPRDVPQPIFLPFPPSPPGPSLPLPAPAVPVEPARPSIPRPGFPRALPSPAPAPTPRPSPTPSPAGRPSPAPFPSVLPFFLPSFQPATSPVTQPIGDPLTVVEAGTLPSTQIGSVTQLTFPQVQPQQDPARCRPRRCKDDRDEPRTECFKGLYRESFTDTDFTQWTEVDCATGREL